MAAEAVAKQGMLTRLGSMGPACQRAAAVLVVAQLSPTLALASTIVARPVGASVNLRGAHLLLLPPTAMGSAGAKDAGAEAVGQQLRPL
jgi:hypothetical protein